MRTRWFGLASLILLLGILAACGSAALEPQRAFAPEMEEVAGKAARFPAADYAVDAATSGFEPNEAQVERMIIWEASISLEVEDTLQAIDGVRAVARDLGGYATSADSWLQDDQLHARLTIRVPAEQFDEAMARLGDMALKVLRQSANSEDVTDQYVDLESRLRHLEAKEAQLLEFLDEAEDTEAVLAVYEHLAQTQAEIEQVKGRMAYLEKLSAMATISIELVPEEAEVQVIEQSWKPAHTLRSAARALVSTLEALANLGIWVVVFLLPVLLLVGVPLLVLVWLVRRRRRRRGQAETPQE